VKQTAKIDNRGERCNLHLGELVRGTASNLGNTEESELCFELLQLGQQLCLGLFPQLMNLYPCFL